MNTSVSIRALLVLPIAVLSLFSLSVVPHAHAQCGGYTVNNPYGPSGQYFGGTNEMLGARLADAWRSAYGNGSDSVQMNTFDDDLGGGGGVGGCPGGDPGGGGGGGSFPSVVIAADPESIPLGQPSTLGWDSTDVSSCSIDQGIGSVTPNETNSRSITPTVTTTYTITCDGINSSVTVTVLPPPPLIGLVGGSEVAQLNAPITLFGAVANQGAGAAGYFPNVIQVCDSGCATVNETLAATPSSSLVAGGWQAISATYTPTSLTRRYYHVCANENTSWVHVHSESDYGNNCSGWQHLAVTDEQPPIPPDTTGSLSCSVSTTNAAVGQTITYSANASGGATGPYVWTDAPDAGASFGSGSTATRVVTAVGSNGMTVQGSNTVLATCPFVTVGSGTTCTGSNADLTITALPTRVRAGQSTLVTWNVSGAGAACTVTGNGVSWSSEVSPAPSCSASGSANPSISAQSTYTLTCGSQTKSVTVNVIPDFQEF